MIPYIVLAGLLVTAVIVIVWLSRRDAVCDIKDTMVQQHIKDTADAILREVKDLDEDREKALVEYQHYVAARAREDGRSLSVDPGGVLVRTSTGVVYAGSAAAEASASSAGGTSDQVRIGTDEKK